MGRKGISKVDLKRVKSLDLLTYYENYEPNELIKNGWNDIRQEHIVLCTCRTVYGVIGLKTSVEKRH